MDNSAKGQGMMNVLVVSGFLGAGKTTLINHILRSRTEETGKIAVIVNEVGELGIDGALLSGRNVDMIELAGGCICCTIRTGFLNAVKEIHETVHPRFLVVEATGVAQPVEVLDMLFERPLDDFVRLNGLVTVVDAGFFHVREALASFYDNQIRFADILILNKTDQVDEDALGEIEIHLRKMNPSSRLIRATHCAVEPSLLFGEGSVYHGHIPAGSRCQGHHTHHEDIGFESFFFKGSIPLDRKKLVGFLDSLPPGLFRIKGWVRFPGSSAFLDFIGGRRRLDPVGGNHPTALAFVGKGCDREEILGRLRECASDVPRWE